MAAGGTKTRVRLRCHDCGNKFYCKDAYPECCPVCGIEFETDPGDVISLPALHGPTSKTPDKVFREMEAASIQRAEQAASIAGVPVAEMSSLKITDLKDNVQVGETYAKAPQNIITQQMDFMRSRGAPVGFQSNARELAASAHIGPDQRAGARALGEIQMAQLKRSGLA